MYNIYTYLDLCYCFHLQQSHLPVENWHPQCPHGHYLTHCQHWYCDLSFSFLSEEVNPVLLVVSTVLILAAESLCLSQLIISVFVPL